MTSHVAVSSKDFVVAFSDSQGTVGMESEVHGGQKLFFGPDFIVAKAGSSLITNPLFAQLATQSRDGTVTASNLHLAIQEYLQKEIRSHHWGEVQFLTATPSSDGKWIQSYMPEVFFNFGSRECFGAIGSGQTFVYRMIERLAILQCPWTQLPLAGTYCVTKRLADAANESLTVDDTHLVGLIANGKCYAMGDKRITPSYLDTPILEHWPSVAKKFDEITAIAETANSLIDQAFRNLHGVWSGHIEIMDAAVSVTTANEVEGQFAQLESKLLEYFAWYDGMLER
ncbi:hypothetical protein [Novipirellula sp.]|uniref:hypothetical protein n=1 Tax=Novipirellula sp. TaxID=2795430 RepID=UPI0035698348